MDSQGVGKPATRRLIIFLRVVQAGLLAGTVLLLTMAAISVLFPSVLEPLITQSDPAASPGLSSVTFACLMAAVTSVAWFYVITLLIRVVQTVKAGDPFVEENISRLRTMWILIAATEIFRTVVHAMADISVSPSGVSAAETGLDIRLGTWFLVLVIAALSEAFRHGAKMRAEAELTI